MATRLLMVLMVAIVIHSKSVQCVDIHITASSNDRCVDRPCLTLLQFSRSALLRNETNITLILEAGNHRLKSKLQIAHISSFNMIANTSSISDSSVIIDCKHRGAFTVTGVNTVFMENMNFVHCSGITVESVDDFIIVDSKFKGTIQGHVHPGSLIKIIGYTSARFIRTSFEQNAFGTTLQYFEIGGVFQLLDTHVGGAIYAQESNIEIVECLFEKNKAGLGGAIFIRNSSKITINGTSFIKNVASYRNTIQIHEISGPGILQYVYGQAGGGALFAENSSVLITNSSFLHNEGENGGAVRYYSEYDDRIITVIRSNFTNNVAYDGGGAISCNTANTTISITNCNFVNNTALGQIVGNGGTLTLVSAFSTHTTIRLSGNNFSNSTSNKSGGAISISGLNFHTSTIIMSHNYFVNNRAGKKGGVLSFLKNPHANKSNDIILIKNVFENNNASEDGGVFEFMNTNVKVTNCIFTDNRANGSGGIFAIIKSKVIIIQSSFQFNTAGKDGGVIMSELSNVNITDSGFISNSVERNGHGGVIIAEQTILSITGTSLVDNKARLGGILWAKQAVVEMHSTMASGNSASTDGGVFHTERSEITITETVFVDNRADNNGGIMKADRDSISMIASEFNRSRAGNDGGVIRAYLSQVNASECVFVNNRAENDGGVYQIEQSNLTISNQTYFVDNTADTGGVIWNDAGILKIDQASFTSNKASTGGVIWSDAGTAKIDRASFTGNKATTAAVMWMDRATIRGNRTLIHDNHANYTIIYCVESTIEITGSSLSSNIGSLCAIESTVRLTDTVMTKMQTMVNQIHMNQLEQGGAITAFQSDFVFDGNSLLIHHRASQGGAIHAIESRLHIHGSLTVANNTAAKSGGGIYLYQSELICQRKSTLMLLGNIVMEKGGGIYASGSLIKVKIPIAKSHVPKSSMLSFVSNTADKGGGIFIEMDSKITILKSSFMASDFTQKHETIRFTTNKANYGGAVYVSDDSMCALSAAGNKYCSFQALALYGSKPLNHFHIECNDNSCKSIYFDENRARISGHSIYGGLLDRCKISPLAEMLLNNTSMGYRLSKFNRTAIIVGGLAYLRSISNIKNADIASPPVRVCFCRDGQPDCSYNPGPVPIRRDQLTEIPLSLAALDQINRPIEATIYNRLSSGDDLCQHHIQINNGNCSTINFTASLNLNESQSEELILLTNGPCKEIPNSQVRLTLTVYCPKCPIGFELLEDEEGCRCQCDKNLFPFISNCRPSSKTLVRDKNIWIAYLNSTDDSEGYQYLKHPYCPFDYCHPSSSRVEINLNLPNGSDAQCANSRTGLLCGTCQPGLSLSLDSSHCIRCPPHWPVSLAAIIIATLLAGILLVAFILLLNLTVAIGTLNAIIFYANILAASNSTFLNFSNTNFATVFIILSWFNLEAGFNACFFEGMDAFWKTVLQLAFPIYIIFLVIFIIVICEHSNKFSNLIGKRNPVATLATLILLSYTNLLNTVITSLSFAVLHYPDGSQRTVWLADASIEYLRGKHVILFIIACIILIAGVFYTALLLFWPYLLRYHECFLLRWTKYPKLCHFIEPYHAPYVFKHRYWTGLLLLSRVLLHLVSAVNTTGDPRLTIVAISLIISCLLLIKGVVASKVYRNRLVDISETIVLFNLLALSALTWYNLDTNKSQDAVTYISVMIIFVLLLAVIGVHIYKYTNLFAIIKRSRLFKIVSGTKEKANTNEHSKPSVTESTQSHSVEPTYSIVEVRNPQLYPRNCN